MPEKLIRVIVFDYDGTLVDSNEVKRDAFFSLFPKNKTYFELINTVLHDISEGSRYDIIREVLVRLHKKNWCPEELSVEIERLAALYDHIATEGAATCPERSGAKGLLEKLAKDYPLYMLSTTPETSLRYIISRRGWKNFFKIIRGFPCDKALELKTFAEAEDVKISEVLMVGDSESDMKAALKAGSLFFYLKEDIKTQRLLDFIINNYVKEKD